MEEIQGKNLKNMINIQSTFGDIAAIVYAVAALFFVIVADARLNVNAKVLIFAALFGIGATVVYFVANYFKEKIALSIILKFVALLLGAAFIGFTIYFKGSSYFPTITAKVPTGNLIFYVSFIGSIIASVALVANIIFSFILKDVE